MCEAFHETFTKLLVAPAALGLLASVSATEIDIDRIANYSNPKAKIKKFDSSTFSNKIATEISVPSAPSFVQNQNFEAGGFSDTTLTGGFIFTCSCHCW